MHAVIHHTITDGNKWGQLLQKITAMLEGNRLPQGLKPLEYLPSTDGRKAVCLWEADSLNALRGFMDQETLGAARNDYFEVKVEDAIGLPKGAESVVSRAA